ncbi:MAG: preprotein translocase subunit SecA, partial [Pygmaiobacter sp.]
AGRGTDIMLGGNADFMAKADLRKAGFSDELIAEADGHAETDDAEIIEVRDAFTAALAKYKPIVAEEAERVCAAGGLYIIGTERHESRRIDNQLRGRAGRQGDPGASRFYLSLEDDLMRLFGGDRVQTLMDTLKVDEDTPIESRMITSIIESAQKKIEAQNFSIRKSVLSFDDVMNQQREIIYGQRGKVLEGEDVSGSIHNMVHEAIAGNVALFAAGDLPSAWDLSGLRDHYRGWMLTDADLRFEDDELAQLTHEKLETMLYERAMDICAKKEARYTAPVMRELERAVLLRNVDTKWMEHIDNMDELRKGIYLRSYGQRDPVVEYRIEGFDMFDAMIESIKEDTARMLLTVEIRTDEGPKREQVAVPMGEGVGGEQLNTKQPVKVTKIGR